jgi:hypothetical protein
VYEFTSVSLEYTCTTEGLVCLLWILYDSIYDFRYYHLSRLEAGLHRKMSAWQNGKSHSNSPVRPKGANAVWRTLFTI